jgi:hypothetical protein
VVEQTLIKRFVCDALSGEPGLFQEFPTLDIPWIGQINEDSYPLSGLWMKNGFDQPHEIEFRNVHWA